MSSVCKTSEDVKISLSVFRENRCASSDNHEKQEHNNGHLPHLSPGCDPNVGSGGLGVHGHGGDRSQASDCFEDFECIQAVKANGAIICASDSKHMVQGVELSRST